MRQDDMARARLWQVLTTDLRDLFGTRPDEEQAPLVAQPQRVTCSNCCGTGVVMEPTPVPV